MTTNSNLAINNIQDIFTRAFIPAYAGERKVKLMLDNKVLTAKPPEGSDIPKKMRVRMQNSEPRTISLPDLADHLIGGKSITISAMNENEFISQQVFGLDFDEDYSHDEFKADCNKHGLQPFLVYKTLSNSPEKPNKFRALFCLDHAAAEDEASKIRLYLEFLFPKCDKACKDANRMFYGGKGIIEQSEDTITIDISKLPSIEPQITSFKAAQSLDLNDVDRVYDHVNNGYLEFLPFWIEEGSKHKMCMGVAGYFAQNHITQAVCEAVVKKLCESYEGEGLKAHLHTIEDRYEQVAKGTKVPGIKVLREIMGKAFKEKSFRKQKETTESMRLLGVRFANEKKNEFRFIVETEEWTTFTGVRWVTGSDAYCLADKAIRYLYDESLGDLSLPGSDQALKGASREFTGIRISLDEFNQKDYLLPCANGKTVDLRDGSVRNSSPDDMFTRCTAVSYPDDPEKEPEEFKKAMKLWFKENPELIPYMLEYLAVNLSGLALRTLQICHGELAHNGKSTLFTGIMRNILGDTASNGFFAEVSCTAFAVKKDSTVANSELAKLNGIRSVTVDEFNDDFLDGWIAKKFCSGEKSRYKAREYFHNLIEITVKACLTILCNDLPALKKFDGGIGDRFKKIPFEHRITEAEEKGFENNRFADSLKAEEPYILSYLVKHFKAWFERGDFKYPKIVDIETNAMKNKMNPVANFIKTLDFSDPMAHETAWELNSTLTTYMRDVLGMEPTNQVKRLATALVDNGARSKVDRSTKRQVWWMGVKFKD